MKQLKRTSILGSVTGADIVRVQKLLPPISASMQDMGPLCLIGQKLCVLIYRKMILVDRLCSGSPKEFRQGRALSDPKLCEFNTALQELGQLEWFLRRAIHHSIGLTNEVRAVAIQGEWYMVPMYEERTRSRFDAPNICSISCSNEVFRPSGETWKRQKERSGHVAVR